MQAILAISNNNVIGVANKLPWHIKEDLQHFKRYTDGKTLVAGTNTFINPTNIKEGNTVTILVNTTGSATVSFPGSVKQPVGSIYVPTTTTSVDVLSLMSYNSSTIYLASTKNFN